MRKSGAYRGHREGNREWFKGETDLVNEEIPYFMGTNLVRCGRVDVIGERSSITQWRDERFCLLLIRMLPSKQSTVAHV